MLRPASPWSSASLSSRAKNGAGSIPAGGTHISPASGMSAARARAIRSGRSAMAQPPFCSSCSDIDLNEARHAPVRFRHRLAQRLDQAGPVQRMDRIEQRHGIVRLVRLQLADQMQPHIGIGVAQGRPFALCLLHAVLAEMALPRRQQRLDRVRRMGLADRDQRHVVRIAARDFRHARDAAVDVRETGRWVGGCVLGHDRAIAGG